MFSGPAIHFRWMKSIEQICMLYKCGIKTALLYFDETQNVDVKPGLSFFGVVLTTR